MKTPCSTGVVDYRVSETLVVGVKSPDQRFSTFHQGYISDYMSDALTHNHRKINHYEVTRKLI